MLPKYHIIGGALFSIAIFLLFPQAGILGVSIIFLSSFLIDVDHYIPYAIKKKDWSLRNAYNWQLKIAKKILSMPRKERNKFYVHLCFLHGFEVLFILFLLGFFVSPLFFFVVIGFTFHLILDAIHEPRYWDRMDKMSLIYDYFKYKKLKYLKDE